MKLEPVYRTALGYPAGQCRAVRVHMGAGREPAVLLAYCADFDVDPYVEMFFFPTDTLKLALVEADGNVLWQRDLGPAVVPGMWFCPVYAFDMDGDGVDEIWFVDNVNTQHPLALSGYRLARLDAHTGEPTGHWKWPQERRNHALSHMFRNFIVGAYVHREPVLVTAQGTYDDMALQGWNPDMSWRWDHFIAADEPGARGSHMFPVLDINGDGVDELLWGERCIEADTGRELWCADRDSWHGHSDIIQPVWDADGSRWFVCTARESDGPAGRVKLYDAAGEQVWADVDAGHMDMGWVARLEPDRHTAMAIRIGHKTCGPDGRFHQDRAEFAWDALTGEPKELPFSVYGTVPVDFNGDGMHELAYAIPGQEGAVIMPDGTPAGRIAGTCTIAGQLADRPGEQLLAYEPDGTITLWADADATDSPEATARYAHPFYDSCARRDHSARAGL